jgi:hypothetical protein
LLFSVHGVSEVRQTVIHTVGLLVSEPCDFEVEMSVKKLKRYESPGFDQIPTEMIKADGRKILSEIHKIIIFIWNKEEMPEEWKESINVPIYKEGDKTDCINYRGISLMPICYPKI